MTALGAVRQQHELPDEYPLHDRCNVTVLRSGVARVEEFDTEKEQDVMVWNGVESGKSSPDGWSIDTGASHLGRRRHAARLSCRRALQRVEDLLREPADGGADDTLRRAQSGADGAPADVRRGLLERLRRHGAFPTNCTACSRHVQLAGGGHLERFLLPMQRGVLLSRAAARAATRAMTGSRRSRAQRSALSFPATNAGGGGRGGGCNDDDDGDLGGGVGGALRGGGGGPGGILRRPAVGAHGRHHGADPPEGYWVDRSAHAPRRSKCKRVPAPTRARGGASRLLLLLLLLVTTTGRGGRLLGRASYLKIRRPGATGCGRSDDDLLCAEATTALSAAPVPRAFAYSAALGKCKACDSSSNIYAGLGRRGSNTARRSWGSRLVVVAACGRAPLCRVAVTVIKATTTVTVTTTATTAREP